MRENGKTEFIRKTLKQFANGGIFPAVEQLGGDAVRQGAPSGRVKRQQAHLVRWPMIRIRENIPTEGLSSPDQSLQLNDSKGCQKSKEDFFFEDKYNCIF